MEHNVKDTVNESTDLVADTGPMNVWASEEELWVAEASRFDAMLGPATAAIIDAAALNEGDRAIDVGCGTGALTRSVLHELGSTGDVSGIDVSPAMIEAARRADGGNITWYVGDASSADVGYKSTIAVSRFAMMLFADHVAGFSNVRRLLAPGGRLVAAVWRGQDVNEWSSLPLSVASRHLGPMPDRQQRAFALADLDELRGVLDIAGFIDVEVQPLDFKARMGSSPEDVISFLCSTPMGSILGMLDPEVQQAILSDLSAELTVRTTGQGVMLDAGAWLIRAHRRGSCR